MKKCFTMPRASAKSKAAKASNEEQELLRLRKELMEKQAKLKRALAQGKRQGNQVQVRVRVERPRAFFQSKQTRSRLSF